MAINYLDEEQSDAEVTRDAVEAAGSECLLIPGDLTRPDTCAMLIKKTLAAFGQIDILVSNAAHQKRKDSIEDLSDKEMQRTFSTNVFAYMRLAREVVPHMKRGAVIIATSSETGILGSEKCPTIRRLKAPSTPSRRLSPSRSSKKGSGSTLSHPGQCGRLLIDRMPGYRQNVSRSLALKRHWGDRPSPKSWRRRMYSSHRTQIRLTSREPSCRLWVGRRLADKTRSRSIVLRGLCDCACSDSRRLDFQG